MSPLPVHAFLVRPAFTVGLLPQIAPNRGRYAISTMARGARIVALFLLAFDASFAHAQNVIEAVSSSIRSGAEVVRIDLAKPLTAVPNGFIVQTPARIAIDFPGASSTLGRAAIEMNLRNLRSVNVAQAGERSRVVLNLHKATAYRAELQGQSVLIVLEPVAGNLIAAPTDNGDVLQRNSPITLNFTNADIESVARTIALVTGRDLVIDPRVKGKMDLVTDRAIAPEAAFTQFSSLLRLQGFVVVQSGDMYKVVPEADAKHQTGTVTTSTNGIAAIDSNQIVTQVFRLNYESPNSLQLVLRPLITSNNMISVNLGNNSLVITDYVENMRRLARIIAALDVPNASDVEVIPLRHSIAAELAPLVTTLLEGGGASSGGGMGSSSRSDASATSFHTTLLPEPRSNALILRAANPARAQLARSLIEKLDRPPAETGNGSAGNIYVVYLKNADAVRLAVALRAAMAANQQSGTSGAQGGGSSPMPQQASLLQNTQTGMGAQGGSAAANAPLNNANLPSTGGQIQADPSTNSLIITAPEPQYRQMRAVIDKLDSRRAQVMIEALIVEVSATKATSFGVQWQSALGKNALIGTNSSLNGANILALTKALAAKNPTGVQLSSGLNLGVAGKIGGQYILGAIANFFSNDNDANVLSTPNLLTLDNEEAKIVIGQNVPFVTGQYANTSGSAGINPFTTVERKDVGLTLRVRPQINENGTVKMVIFQEISSVAAGTTADPNGPTTNKRTLESSVLVEDGGLVMLGGLLSDSYGTHIEKVPVAGDIPVVGNLFRSENRKREKSNLMMFLRPVVMRDAATTESFAYDRYDEIRSMQKHNQPNADNIMLRNVNAASLLPEAPLPRKGSMDTGQLRVEGTQLIPLPAAAVTNKLPPVLRGALPPTADPATSREMP